LIIYFYFYQLDIFRAIEYLASRSLDFNILNDPSSLSRITKFVESFKEVSYLGGLLGHGLKSERIWYDGIFSMLMAHGGLSIILLFIIFYYSIIKRIYFNIYNSRNSVILLFLIGLYFLSNLITEHVMVSRNAFPVLVFLSTLYVSIKNKISSSKL
jgi:hypothetical protein